MKQRMLRFADRYRALALIAALLLICNAAFSQNYTNTSAWGYHWNNGWAESSLAIPSDTFAIPAAYQNLPHIAYKDSLLYLWSPTLHRWNTNGTIISGGTGGGGVDYTTKQNFTDTSTYDATRWWVLSQLSSYTPLSRFLDSMTAARLRYLKSSDTAWIHQQLTLLQTNSASNSNLVFSDGLVWSSVDNHVRAQFASPIWDANRIQSYPVSAVVCNGCVPYLDSANRIIRWGLATGGVMGNIDWVYDSLAAHWAKISHLGFVARGPHLIGIPGQTVYDKDTLALDDIMNSLPGRVTALEEQVDMVGVSHEELADTAAAIRAGMGTSGGQNIMNANLTLDSNRVQDLASHRLSFITGSTGEFYAGHGRYPDLDFNPAGIASFISVNRSGNNVVESYVSDFTRNDGFLHENWVDVSPTGIDLYHDRYGGADGGTSSTLSLNNNGVVVSLTNASDVPAAERAQFVVEGLSEYASDAAATADGDLPVNAAYTVTGDNNIHIKK